MMMTRATQPADDGGHDERGRSIQRLGGCRDLPGGWVTRAYRLRGQRGITLIELIVALAIGLLAIGAVVITITSIRGANVRASASTMASMMRYLYNRSVHTNSVYRLVIDLDKQTYWGEAMTADDPCSRFIVEEGEGGDLPAPRIIAGSKDDEEEAEAADEDGDPLAEGGQFAAADDELLRERDFEMGVKVVSVITQHHQSSQGEGKVAIHFFPGGHAERSYVWFGEPEGDDGAYVATITLELASLMGSTYIHGSVLDDTDFYRESKK